MVDVVRFGTATMSYLPDSILQVSVMAHISLAHAHRIKEFLLCKCPLYRYF